MTTDVPPPGTVRVVVEPDEVELLSDLLWWSGAEAISETAVAGGVELLAGFPSVAAAGAAAARLDGRSPEVAAVTDDSWLDEWKRHAEPIEVAGRVVLWPSWVAGAPTADRVVVRLDAARAFGSGSHPSTRLVVAGLAGRDLSGARVLDVGCGSGVLAIAAVLLGAARADGVDLDPVARQVTVANVELNEVGERVRVVGATESDVAGGYDLVVANIGARTLVELAPALAARAPELVLSGILTEQAPQVIAAFEGWAARVSPPDDGWVAVVLTDTSPR